jgi:hypothetical protein
VLVEHCGDALLLGAGHFVAGKLNVRVASEPAAGKVGRDGYLSGLVTWEGL